MKAIHGSGNRGLVVLEAPVAHKLFKLSYGMLRQGERDGLSLFCSTHKILIDIGLSFSS